MFRKKLIPAYFLLVGLPLLALLVVLKAGAGLSAPAAVSVRTGGIRKHAAGRDESLSARAAVQ